MKTYQLSAPPRQSRIDYQSELNPRQLEVVEAGEGPLLVIAGAGSGKTRTLTYRVARLIDRGVAPTSIVLCTFTNKAAREMLSRVEHLVEAGARQVWGGTFHHLANRILRQHSTRIGHQPGYTILDQEDARDVLGACMAAGGNQPDRKRMPRPAVLLSLISLAVNTQTPLDQVVLSRAPTLVPILDELGRIARAYRDKKREMDAMDFDDLLANLKLLMNEHSDVRDQVAGGFQHVLVDEYQDTNVLQCDIVDLLAVHRNLTVVGDDAQSIYGFRGADPGNMLSFEQRWPGTSIHKLEINYRSTPEILEVANASIVHNRDQLPKTLEATRPSGAAPALVTVRDTETQAAFVAQRVMELADEGYALGEMAVLYRAHSHSLELQVELTRRGIAFQVRSGLRFFEQAHIKDVLSHLRILDNPRDELSWMRVLKLQPGIGRTTAARIWDHLADTPDPYATATAAAAPRLPGRSRSGFEGLQRLLRALGQSQVRASASASIQAVLDEGYRDMLPDLYVNARSRQEDIEQLARYAEHFENPTAFLSELNLLTGFTSEEVLGGSRPEEQLTLSTIHQAKGLEWKVVFALSLNEGLFPHPWALQENDQDDQEERRLFYVTLTRTMDELYLIHTLVADRAGGRRVVLKPSRFLEEIRSCPCLEPWTVQEEG